MSKLIQNNILPYVALSTGEKYGIKPESNGIVLPVRFENESEVREFENQIRALYKDTEIMPDKISSIVFRKKTWEWLIGIFRGEIDVFLNVKTENTISLSYFYDRWNRGNIINRINWSSLDKEGEKAMDTVLKKTILGKKLKKLLD